MAMASCNIGTCKKTPVLHLSCRKKERDHFHPYKVIEITPPPKNLGIRCFPPSDSTITHQKQGSEVTFRQPSMLVRLYEHLNPLDAQEELAMWGECDNRRPSIYHCGCHLPIPASQGEV
ncbi:uncharacterized protein LOC110601955 isoform X1 [Manihot esculenta]|uniref:uncharacterized protein LOC110601955 isoform X1 n=1 Tax=Manihot esculenta TaxID=3983 RepID=UPI000B5D14D5|nr:uncharacterized protein LOC110601955 isoform X1 [Manihot esculenta]